MKKLKDVVIETDRLKLLPTSVTYAEDIFKEFTDEITTFMFPKSPDSIEQTIEYLRHSEEKIEKGTDLPVAIFDKKTNEFLGHGGIHRINTDTPELGIWIKKSAHGHKYGREAVTALKEWADQNLKYKYIIYPADKRNIPSRKIAEALGGVAAADYQKINLSGNLIDGVEYRIYPNKA